MPDRILSAGESLENDGAEKPTKPRRRKNRSNSSGNKSPKKDHPLYAALDLGTNNCRLLIARPSG